MARVINCPIASTTPHQGQAGTSRSIYKKWRKSCGLGMLQRHKDISHSVMSLHSQLIQNCHIKLHKH